MFAQTFIDGLRQPRKKYTVALSVVLQTAALCILVLIPLIYTEVLPGAQLRSMLIAPSPPPAAPPTPVKPKRRNIVRRLSAKELIFPQVIPKQVTPITEADQAPDIGVTSSTGGSAGPGDAVGDSLLSATPGRPPIPVAGAQQHASNVPLRVGGNVAAANLVRQVQPVYPPLARAARIQGGVVFRAVISKEGKVEDLQLVRGHPLLVNAAKQAILQWRYRPTLLNGLPVEVVTEFRVRFMLAR